MGLANYGCWLAEVYELCAQSHAVLTACHRQETQRLMAEPVPGISAVPDEQNARYFHVVVTGKPRDELCNCQLLPNLYIVR